VNGAGWEAWLLPLTGPLRPGCKTLGLVSPSSVTESRVLGTDVWPGSLACLCIWERGRWG
jgi:hypothetical protein